MILTLYKYIKYTDSAEMIKETHIYHIPICNHLKEIKKGDCHQQCGHFQIYVVNRSII